MFDGQGTELTQPTQILEVQREFYRDLYEEEQDVNFNLENRYNVFVPDNIRKEQNLQLTLSDLEVGIKGMSKNKTPGEDGIPVDFYKVFWKEIKEVFHTVMLQCYEDKSLHSTARRGILNLIPKTGKDTRYVKNLRPITLLNTDYKIIEKAVANKMTPALEHIIHQDQRG